jgi:hypothetical protein
MRNLFRLLGIIFLGIVIGFSMSSCPDPFLDDGNIVTITGITGKTGEAQLFVYTGHDVNQIVAVGRRNISNNSATFSMLNYKKNLKPWTGKGSYYLDIGFDYGDIWYTYTEGKTQAQLGLTEIYTSDEDIVAKLPKYTFSSASSTIDFSQFVRLEFINE